MVSVTRIYLFKPTLCCQDLSLDTIGTSAFTKDRFFRKAQNCLVKTNLKDQRVNYLALLPCSVLQVKYMDRLVHILFNLTRQFWTSLKTDACDNNLIIFLVEGLQSTIQLVPFALAILSGVTKGAVYSILSKCAGHYYCTTLNSEMTVSVTRIKWHVRPSAHGIRNWHNLKLYNPGFGLYMDMTKESGIADTLMDLKSLNRAVVTVIAVASTVFVLPVFLCTYKHGHTYRHTQTHCTHSRTCMRVFLYVCMYVYEFRLKVLKQKK